MSLNTNIITSQMKPGRCPNSWNPTKLWPNWCQFYKTF